MDKKFFEEWLQDYHCTNNPEILDDNLPEAYDDWIAELDCEEWIRLGTLFGTHLEYLFSKKGELNGQN